MIDEMKKDKKTDDVKMNNKKLWMNVLFNELIFCYSCENFNHYFFLSWRITFRIIEFNELYFIFFEKRNKKHMLKIFLPDKFWCSITEVWEVLGIRVDFLKESIMKYCYVVQHSLRAALAFSSLGLRHIGYANVA